MEYSVLQHVHVFTPSLVRILKRSFFTPFRHRLKRRLNKMAGQSETQSLPAFCLVGKAGTISIAEGL
jgi:hypothetical protein